MAYSPITPTRFKQLKPQFAAVDDVVVQGYIDLAQLWVDGSWPERAWEAAQSAIVCHLMTMDGLGADVQSKSFASGVADYESIKTGTLTLTRYQKAAGAMDYTSWLAQTKCGAFFLQLLNMAKGGPRIAMGGRAGCYSPYAKDWPAWWPGAGR